MMLPRTLIFLSLSAAGWCVGSAVPAAAQGSVASDRAALLALYDATGGPSWVDRTNWNTNRSLREWFGVETDPRGRVTRLDLEDNGLAGAIPAALGNLAQLFTLDLSRNELTGAIPAAIGELKKLRFLYLWENKLTGPIPSALRNLDRLESLSLGENGLTGPIPNWLNELSGLRYLLLWQNEFTGPIPAALRNLDGLESLDLGGNHLTGTVPSWLGELPRLRWLWLWGNELTGPIPAALRNLNGLESLYLGGNHLTGTVPSWLGELPRLRWLSLWGNELTGPIPAALRNLGGLESLDLGGNHLTGTVPSWLGELPRLRRLSLWGNELTGPIPAALRNLDRLESLDLGGNHLTGTVPSWLGELPRFRWLSLWGNELTGSIPTALRALEGLDMLDLGGNDLTGPVPTWLGDLVNLQRLELQGNELSGTVPITLGNLRNLERLYVSYNPLEGELPQTLTQLEGMRELSIGATALCAPSDAVFLAWLARVERFSGETCNRAPEAVGAIPAQALTDGESHGVMVARYFADPDDEQLIYAAKSSDSAHVKAVVSGDTVWLSPREAGETGVTVTACDRRSLCAFQRMEVTVHSVSDSSSPGDREILEAFYDATGGAGWTDDTNWKTSAPLASWYGVTTNSSGRVVGLDLRRNGLTASIPVALRSMDALESLDLGWNSLAGPIPTWLGELTNLRALWLGGNDFAGSIPADLGSLTDLHHLGLGYNELSGPIPATLRNLRNLESLYLHRNRLSGSIPKWLKGLQDLRRLHLGGNNLTGPIPGGLGTLSRLQSLALDNNDFSPGTIPAEFGDLAQLESLYLGGARRTGAIPPELGKLKNLRILSLYDNGLSGPIPEELGRMTELTDLYLSGNFGLSGLLPPEWHLPDLERLDISLTQTCAPDAWREQMEGVEFEGLQCVTPDEAVVDVAVFYTPPAREAAGSTAAIEAEIDLMIATTNKALQDSGVQMRVALVARSEVSYTETGISGTDLQRFRDPSDGFMDEIHEVRERVGADLVHLIPARSDAAGRGQVYGAFGLSRWPGWSVPHELGHNLGLHHDRYQDLTKRRLYSHPAYGYVNATGVKRGARKSTQWRTIMAYATECKDQFASCNRVPRYSNPRERYNGEPTGIPVDVEAVATAWSVTGPADAASVLDVTGPAVAAWRDRPAGSVETPSAAAFSNERLPGPPGGNQIAPPARIEGLFFDPLLAAVEPSTGAATPLRVTQSPDPMFLRQRVVAVDFRQLGEAAAELELNLFDDAAFTGIVERTAPTFSGGYVLSGRLAGMEYSTMTIVVNGGVVAGRVWTPRATFRISPAGGGLHAIRQVDPTQGPPLGDPLPRPLRDGDRRDPQPRR